MADIQYLVVEDDCIFSRCVTFSCRFCGSLFRTYGAAHGKSNFVRAFERSKFLSLGFHNCNLTSCSGRTFVQNHAYLCKHDTRDKGLTSKHLTEDSPWSQSIVCYNTTSLNILVRQVSPSVSLFLTLCFVMLFRNFRCSQLFL